VAIQGRRCRQRLFGVVVDSIGLMLAVARGQARSGSRGSERRKPEAWKLKIRRVLVDNKSAAEISKRHLLVGARGTSSAGGDGEKQNGAAHHLDKASSCGL
jgi:hypothetical protein